MQKTVAPSFLVETTVKHVALSLGVSRQRANKLLLDGRISGAVNVNGRWQVSPFGFLISKGSRGPKLTTKGKK